MDAVFVGSSCNVARILLRPTPTTTPMPTSSAVSTQVQAHDLSAATASSSTRPVGRQNQDSDSDSDTSSDSGSSTTGNSSTHTSSSKDTDTTSHTTSQSSSSNSSDSSTNNSTSDSTSGSTSESTSHSTTTPTTTSGTPTTSSSDDSNSSTRSSTSDTTDTTSNSPTQSSSSSSSSSSSFEPSSTPPPDTTSGTTSMSSTSLPSALVTADTLTNSSTASFQTTITSAIGTVVVNGTTSTIFTAIPTTISSDNSVGSSATKRNIIAGAVGSVAFLLLVAALFLFYRRHQTKKLSFFKRMQPKPRTRLLEDDDFEFGPPMTRYTDYPASVISSHAHSRSMTTSGTSPIPTQSPVSRSFHDPSPGPSVLNTPIDPHRSATPTQTGGLPPGAAIPLLLGMRAETGSIFREAVWPPPGETSALVDPLTRGSSSVDLSRIVDEVMGPSSTSPSHPPSAFRGVAVGASVSTSSLVGEDPFASYSTLPHIHPSQPSSATHSRETSGTPLIGPSRTADGFFPRDRGATPEPPLKMGPLFVTNMSPTSPTSTMSPGTPPAAAAAVTIPPATVQPRNWLQRSPKKATGDVRPSFDSGQDVADVTSIGHAI